jgi:hypothetical protein
VINNTFRNCETGVLLGGGRHHTVQGNAFENVGDMAGGQSVWIDARGLNGPGGPAANPNCRYNGTFHQELQAVQFTRPPWSTHCPGPPARLRALSMFLCKSGFYGAFVWACRALNSQKRRFPARADPELPRIFASAAGYSGCEPAHNRVLGNTCVGDPAAPGRFLVTSPDMGRPIEVMEGWGDTFAGNSNGSGCVLYT